MAANIDPRAPVAAPAPTPAPAAELVKLRLNPRQGSYQTCGYANGDILSGRVCQYPRFCATNTFYSAAGCCADPVESCTLATTCYNYADTCTGDCLLNPFNFVCANAAQPYCVTFEFMEPDPYVGFSCSEVSLDAIPVYTTLSGSDDDNNGASISIAPPVGFSNKQSYTPAATHTVVRTVGGGGGGNDGPAPTAVSTIVVPVSGGSSSTTIVVVAGSNGSSGSNNGGSGVSSSHHKGGLSSGAKAGIGGGVGGAAALALLAGLFFWLRNRSRRTSDAYNTPTVMPHSDHPVSTLSPAPTETKHLSVMSESVGGGGSVLGGTSNASYPQNPQYPQSPGYPQYPQPAAAQVPQQYQYPQHH